MIHIMLPAQYASRGRLAEPQKRHDGAQHGRHQYRRATGKGAVGVASVRQAVAYVASTDRAWPFSFENVCDALGLDAGALREELMVVSGAV